MQEAFKISNISCTHHHPPAEPTRRALAIACRLNPTESRSSSPPVPACCGNPLRSIYIFGRCARGLGTLSLSPTLSPPPSLPTHTYTPHSYLPQLNSNQLARSPRSLFRPEMAHRRLFSILTWISLLVASVQAGSLPVARLSRRENSPTDVCARWSHQSECHALCLKVLFYIDTNNHSFPSGTRRQHPLHLWRPGKDGGGPDDKYVEQQLSDARAQRGLADICTAASRPAAA